MRKLAALLVVCCVMSGAGLLAVKSFHKQEKVKEKAHALRQAIMPKPVILSEAANPQHKSECEALVSSVDQNGSIVKNWRLYGTHGDVRVRSAYYHVNLEQKRSLDKALRCVMSEGREDDQGLKQITYRNARNDQLVAVWEKSSGFKMAE